MKKLTLNIESLQVQSFETAAAESARPGTVQGFAGPQEDRHRRHQLLGHRRLRVGARLHRDLRDLLRRLRGDLHVRVVRRRVPHRPRLQRPLSLLIRGAGRPTG